MRQSSLNFLTLSCADRPAIIASVTSAIAQADGNIVEAAQSVDGDRAQFFMRAAFTLPHDDLEHVREKLGDVADRLGMSWSLRSSSTRRRVLIMVSKFDHCLNDLLYRHSIGELAMDIPLIVSNHPDAKRHAEAHKIAFHHLPVTAANKLEQEAALEQFVEAEKIDLIVLARYMQILSPRLCGNMSGRIINIHHSFLPSFKGARPYHQAHERGVKLIGATAHYVTSDLDEGPIIEQEAIRVSHDLSADDLVAVGREIESRVLARSVKFHVEDRVILNGGKTIVFN